MSLFPRFAMETYPPAKVAKVAKPGRYFSSLATLADTSGEITKMESEYFTLLKKYWLSREDETAFTMDEVRELVNRLDELYRELNSQGRRVPIRLPVEREVDGDTSQARNS